MVMRLRAVDWWEAGSRGPVAPRGLSGPSSPNSAEQQHLYRPNSTKRVYV